MLETVAGNDAYIDNIRAQAAQAGIPYEVHGEGGPGTYATAFSVEIISQWIFYTVLLQQAAEEDVEITDEVRGHAEVLISYVFGAQEVPERSQLGEVEPFPAGIEILDAFDAVYRDYFVDGVAALLALEASRATPVTDEDVAAFYEENQEFFEQACVSHILVSPDEEAEDPEAAMADAETAILDVVERLEAGEEFAEVATEVSDDPGSGAQGGELGCGPRNQYVPEFEEVVWSIELDTLSEPVRTDFGYHLILVSERGTQTLEEVADQIRAQLESSSGQDFQEELAVWMTSADVVVTEQYGTWDAQSGLVEEPVDPSAPTTTVPLMPEVPFELVPEDLPVPAEG